MCYIPSSGREILSFWVSCSCKVIPILGALYQKFNQPTRGIDPGLHGSKVWRCVVGELVPNVSKKMFTQRDKL